MRESFPRYYDRDRPLLTAAKAQTNAELPESRFYNSSENRASDRPHNTERMYYYTRMALDFNMQPQNPL